MFSILSVGSKRATTCPRLFYEELGEVPFYIGILLVGGIALGEQLVEHGSERMAGVLNPAKPFCSLRNL